MNQPQITAEPAELILLDDIDRVSLTVGDALAALTTLGRLLDSQEEGSELTGRQLAPLIRCIGTTARSGWPL